VTHVQPAGPVFQISAQGIVPAD